MASKTFNITAISPFILYTGDWQTSAGATVNGNISVVPPPTRTLQSSTGTLKVNGFMNAISVRGSQSGVGCSYTASIKSQRQNDNTPLPSAQTSPQDANLLVSFSALPFGPYSLTLEANCNAAAHMEVVQVEMGLWCGDSEQTVTQANLDDTSPLLTYSNNDWTVDSHLDATFFNDTQHYTVTNSGSVSLTLTGASIVTFYGSLDPTHGPFRVNISGPSTSLTSDTYNGRSAFLAVPVPLFIANGLDPRSEHTFTLEKTGAEHLDLDYVEIYKVGGGGPPGGELNSKSNNKNLAVLIGEIIGPVLGFLILAALFWYFIRRRRTRVQQSWANGMEKPERTPFGHRSNHSVQRIHDFHPGSSPPLSPHSEISDSYIPTPFNVHGSTSSPSTTGSMFHPLMERPFSAMHLSPVVARRTNKMAELDQARRLAVVGSAVSTSGTSMSDPHDIPLPLTPDFAAQQYAGTGADSSVVPLVAGSIISSAGNQRPNPHDSHPVGLPDEPPPQYDSVV